MAVATFNISYAKAHFVELLDRAGRGEDVVITRRSVPIARLVGIQPKQKQRARAGALRGRIKFDERFFEPLPDDELALWNGEGD